MRATGYYPVDWHVYMKEAVDDYQKTYGVVYGCSFSDVPEHYGYNWGYGQYPDSKGGYICFKYKVGSCSKHGCKTGRG